MSQTTTGLEEGIVGVSTPSSYGSRSFAGIATPGEPSSPSPRISFRWAAAASRLAADFLTCGIAVFAAYMLAPHTGYSGSYPSEKVLALGAAAGLCAVIFPRPGERDGEWGDIRSIRDTAASMQISTQSLLPVTLLVFSFQLGFPRTAVALAFVLMPSLLLIQKRIYAFLKCKPDSTALLESHSSSRASAKLEGVTSKVLSPPFSVSAKGVEQEAAEDVLQKQIPSVSWFYPYTKRTIDIIVSVALLVLLSPAFVLIYLLIRLESRGPAFFVQRRVGRNGRHFSMYKFRSMSSKARKYERSPTTSNDPRITRIGRLLRCSSIDELPQLLNVLLGDMSLVGPRPEMPFLVRRYNAHQRQRLEVFPGITGLWQLSPDRVSPIHENVYHDLIYIQSRTLWIDLAILLHTPLLAMRGGI